LPLDVDWINDYKEEFRKFTPLMTHKHDDQIDPTMDAVEDLIVFEDMLYSSNAIGA
jgi:phage terminase large subunit-like protein